MDYRFDKVHLKIAKQLVNPDEDVIPLDVEVVKLCLLEMKEGGFGWEGEIKSLNAVTYGAPPFYERMITKIMEMPAIYETTTFDEWVRKYGAIAVRLKVWDGLYPVANEPYRIAVGELQTIYGYNQ